MKETMARLLFRSSFFWEVFEKHFEDWILEEKGFKDESHTLIYSRPLKLKIIDGQITVQAPISLQASMVF